MPKKIKRFRTWKYVQDMVKSCGEDGAKAVAKMLLAEGLNWVKKCEGKTQKQVEKMGFTWHNDWAVEE